MKTGCSGKKHAMAPRFPHRHSCCRQKQKNKRIFDIKTLITQNKFSRNHAFCLCRAGETLVKKAGMHTKTENMERIACTLPHRLHSGAERKPLITSVSGDCASDHLANGHEGHRHAYSCTETAGHGNRPLTTLTQYRPQRQYGRRYHSPVVVDSITGNVPSGNTQVTADE